MPAENDIPRSLVPLYAQQAADGDPCVGLSVMVWRYKIQRLVRRTQAKRILDYGCGNAAAYKQKRIHKKYWGGAEMALYDPAIEKYSEKPRGTFHGVICCDVLEHVPEDELPAFLADLFSYAERFVFMSVCCRPAKRLLPDGQNAHVTVRPFTWWEQLIKPYVPKGVIWKLREAE